MKKLLAIASLLVALQLVHAGSIDEQLYLRIHDGSHSPTVDFVMESMNRLGSREVNLALLLGLATLGDEKARDASKLSVFSLVSGQAVCGVLKVSVNRERPEGADHSRWNSSFPSGHAAGAFSLATVLSNRYPRFRVPFYVLAVAICVSRVYLGCHYPSDVLIGALIGYTSSRIVLRYETEILRFSLW